MKGARLARGFTLVELLIAMTLLALVLTVLFGSLRMSSRIWDAAEKNSVTNTHLFSLQSFLRRQLSQVLPYKINQQTGKQIAFIGEHTRLHMIAPMASRHDPGGLYIISITVEKGQDGNELILRRAVSNPHSISFRPLANAERLVLATDIEHISLQYYGSGSKTGQARWVPAWNVQTRLPLLIRLDVTFTSERGWPSLIVAPVTGSNTGCIWDILENRCMGV